MMPNDTNSQTKETIAALDLGSNSFHAVIAQNKGNEIIIVDRIKEKIQLGKGLTPDNRLNETAMKRGLSCLQRFSEKLESYQVSRVKAVGTNTLRIAKNRNDFLSEASRIFKYPINVIAGREEARLIYHGVRHSGHCDAPSLVIDIGGGSTEVILGTREHITQLDSLHMGCVSYQERFFSANAITKKNFQDAITAASLELLPVVEMYKNIAWEEAIGASGTIQSISNIFIGQGSVDGLITIERLHQLKDQLLHLQYLDYVNLDGICDDRKSILPGGLAILIALFEELGIEKMSVCDAALREGLLYEMMDAESHSAICQSTIDRLVRDYHIDANHAQRVQQTALFALEQVANDWQLDNEELEKLLSWSARVHEIGFIISINQIQKHSAYIIKNSDLHGFNQTQKTLIAAIVRGFRRKFPMETFEKLPIEYRLKCIRLCRLLRLAIVFNHKRIDDDINCFTLKAQDHRLLLAVPERLNESHKLLLADLQMEKKYMESVGFELSIQTV